MGEKYTPETIQKFFDKYNCFEKVNFTSKEVNDHYQEWQNGNHVFFYDFLWSLFNIALIKNSKNHSTSGNESNFYFVNSIIYSCMADFRREENSSKEDINKILKLAEDSRLKSSVTQYSGLYKQEIIVISGHCCEFCDKLNNKTYDLNDYLENPRLDITKCTRERGCNCTTAIKPKRDKNGRLIRK